jgi:hypothetical protein
MKKGVERIERRVKLHDLRVLISVVERGRMAKAAESLATSQPAISRAIADLEYSLGVCLLDRGPRGIVPTPYGHALIRRGIAIFDELKQGRAGYRIPRGSDGGRSPDRCADRMGRRIGCHRDRSAGATIPACRLSFDCLRFPAGQTETADRMLRA